MAAICAHLARIPSSHVRAVAFSVKVELQGYTLVSTSTAGAADTELIGVCRITLVVLFALPKVPRPWLACVASGGESGDPESTTTIATNATVYTVPWRWTVGRHRRDAE